MPYRDEVLICIEIGSYETRAIYGLAESLSPPKIRLKTRVGKRDGSEDYICGEDLEAALSADERVSVIYPVVKGCIADFSALTAFLQHILHAFKSEAQSIQASENPVILIVPPQWSKEDRETMTQLFLRNLLRPAFMIIDMAFASLYACNSMTGIVIDVGHEQINVTAIVDSIAVPSGYTTVDTGGKHMTDNLLAMLRANPPLDQATQTPIDPSHIDFSMAEAIKCSSICEVLPGDFGTNAMAFQTDKPPDSAEDEGVLDIAAVVASGKTREYLAKIQAGKEGSGEKQTVVPNAQLTHNTITLGDRTIVVGRERFRVADVILEESALSNAIYDITTNAAIEPSRRQELWENIVLVGGGARIKGFGDRLIQNLHVKYAARAPPAPADPYTGATSYSTYPPMIRSIKIPPHFPEWNSKGEEESSKGINEEATFLGGCIIAHIAFSSSETSGSARLYSTMADYKATGPVVAV